MNIKSGLLACALAAFAVQPVLAQDAEEKEYAGAPDAKSYGYTVLAVGLATPAALPWGSIGTSSAWMSISFTGTATRCTVLRSRVSRTRPALTCSASRRRSASTSRTARRRVRWSPASTCATARPTARKRRFGRHEPRVLWLVGRRPWRDDGFVVLRSRRGGSRERGPRGHVGLAARAGRHVRPPRAWFPDGPSPQHDG